MNSLYMTLFSTIVAGIVQTFIKSWNQLPYPWVIEVCCLPFEPRHDFFLHLIIVAELFLQRDVSLGEETIGFLRISPSISWRRLSEIKDGLLLLCSSWTLVLPSENSRHHFLTFCRFITLPQTATICLWISAGCSPFALRNCTMNAPRIWRDFGSALSFQTCLTQTKPVLPLSNEHGSQVKDQGWRQCCHNKHTWCIFTFQTLVIQCVPTSTLFTIHSSVFNNLKTLQSKICTTNFLHWKLWDKNIFFSILMISLTLQVHSLSCTYCSLWQSSLQALASTWTSPTWRQSTSHHSSKSHSQPCQAWQPSPSSSTIS